MKCFKQADYIGYNVKISMQTFSVSFLQGILKKKIGFGTSFQATFFAEFFDENVYL